MSQALIQARTKVRMGVAPVVSGQLTSGGSQP